VGSGIENPWVFGGVGAGTSEAREAGADGASDGDAGTVTTSTLSSAGRDGGRLWARAGRLADRGAAASVVGGLLTAEAVSAGATSIGTISGADEGGG
jgi:hypothetical protein